MENKRIQKLIAEITDSKNAINCTKEDIEKIFKLGNEICLKPKKNKLAKGMILFVKDNGKLTLPKVETLSSHFLKKCEKNANTIWALNIDEKRTRNIIIPLMVYKENI